MVYPYSVYSNSTSSVFGAQRELNYLLGMCLLYICGNRGTESLPDLLMSHKYHIVDFTHYSQMLGQRHNKTRKFTKFAVVPNKRAKTLYLRFVAVLSLKSLYKVFKSLINSHINIK